MIVFLFFPNMELGISMTGLTRIVPAEDAVRVAQRKGDGEFAGVGKR